MDMLLNPHRYKQPKLARKCDADYATQVTLHPSTKYVLWRWAVHKPSVYLLLAGSSSHRPNALGCDGNSDDDREVTRIARFMGPTWSPPGAKRTQVGPMLAPWTLLSGCRARKQDTIQALSGCNKCLSKLLQKYRQGNLLVSQLYTL